MKTLLQSFLEILEMLGEEPRIERGRRYAKEGRVKYQIREDRIVAIVEGSNSYRCRLLWPKWSSETSLEILGYIHQSNLYKGLSKGETAAWHQLHTELKQNKQPLYPGLRQSKARCSCPDFFIPCKHTLALLFTLAKELEENPLQLLYWRGISPEALEDVKRGRVDISLAMSAFWELDLKQAQTLKSLPPMQGHFEGEDAVSTTFSEALKPFYEKIPTEP